MHGVGEHVYRLNGRNLIIPAQDGQVTGLGSRIAAYIHHSFRGGVQDYLRHVRMNAGTGRVQDNDIRTAVLCDKGVVQDVLHVSGKEVAIGDSIGIGI